MRLADFILANIEPILVEWEVFARSIWPGTAAADPATLRDHAQDMLLATASAMKSAQTTRERSERSRGRGEDGSHDADVNRASAAHGAERVESGFDLASLIAEYRALRASVIRLWRESQPRPDHNDLDDVSRFHESIDRSLAGAVLAYTQMVEAERKAALDGQNRHAIELREANEALLVSSVRQHELTEQARDAATALGEAKEQAEAANRSKDVFLATLSHEIRTPLNAILGWAQVLNSGGADAEDVREAAEVIERNARAQAALIEDVLDVSRIVSGKIRLEMQPCNLEEILAEAVDSVRASAEAKKIKLSTAIDSSAAGVACDPTRMQQVAWNLLSNAIKFTQVGGEIHLQCAREEGSIRFEVRDNGPGISAEVLPHVFERFRQGDDGIKRSFGGLGLGLSIVRHLVEMHGGTVTASSDGVGKGATFVVTLPVRAAGDVALGDESHDPESGDLATSTGNATEDHPPVRLDGLRILVVDDEADARRLLIRILQAGGAAVTAADSAFAAIDLLPTVRPNLLVSDLGMPSKDGFELIREIRSAGYDADRLPAVALTAFARPEDQHLSLAAGYQVHISKPVDAGELTAVIARLAAISP